MKKKKEKKKKLCKITSVCADFSYLLTRTCPHRKKKRKRTRKKAGLIKSQ